MNNRPNDNAAWRFSWNNLLDSMTVIFQGTFIGLIGRFVTWPLENASYIASSRDNTKSYVAIYRETFRRDSLIELGKIFFRTGALQTMGKSISHMGMINYVNYHYSDYTGWQRGLLTAAYSTPLETMTTSRGEYLKILNFKKLEQHSTQPVVPSPIFTLSFLRVISASFVRIGTTGAMTFCSIYTLDDYLQQRYPQFYTSTPLVKAAIASASSFMIQPLCMPFINFQMAVLKNPQQAVSTAAQSVWHDRALLKGSFGRSLYRGSFYGLTFFAMEKLQVRDGKISEDIPLLKRFQK